MKKLLAYSLSLSCILPFSASADMDFIQKAQNALQTVEQTGMAVQEMVQEAKSTIKDAAEKAKSYKADLQNGLDAVEKMGQETLQEMGTRAEGLLDSKDADAEARAAAVENVYVEHTGQGNDSENYEKSQESMQELLRDAVSKLYAAAFTTRTNLQKEEPQDPELADTGVMLEATHKKALEMLNRLSQIYMLESLQEGYVQTLNLKSVTLDMSKAEETEDKEGKVND